MRSCSLANIIIRLFADTLDLSDETGHVKYIQKNLMENGKTFFKDRETLILLKLEGVLKVGASVVRTRARTRPNCHRHIRSGTHARTRARTHARTRAHASTHVRTRAHTRIREQWRAQFTNAVLDITKRRRNIYFDHTIIADFQKMVKAS